MSSRRKKKSSGLLTAAFIPPVRHLVEADMQLAPVSQAGCMVSALDVAAVMAESTGDSGCIIQELAGLVWNKCTTIF